MILPGIAPNLQYSVEIVMCLGSHLGLFVHRYFIVHSSTKIREVFWHSISANISCISIVWDHFPKVTSILIP